MPASDLLRQAGPSQRYLYPFATASDHFATRLLPGLCYSMAGKSPDPIKIDVEAFRGQSLPGEVSNSLIVLLLEGMYVLYSL